MPTPKPMTGHIFRAERTSVAAKIRFNPPTVVQSIRINNRLVASSDFAAPGIDKISDTVSELETKYLVDENSRLLVGTVTPSIVTVEWADPPTK